MAHTSRKPSAIKPLVAALFGQGKSKSEIARTTHVDRQTVTRILSDPVTQAEMRRLERAAATPAPSAPQRSTARAGAPTPAGPQYKIPLDVVPLETRKIT